MYYKESIVNVETGEVIITKDELLRQGKKLCSKCKVIRDVSEFYIKTKTKVYGDKYHYVCKQCYKDFRLKRKLLVFRYYSKSEIPYCDCCLEDKIEFLSIDHIVGGGKKHRESIKINEGISVNGWRFYKWLIDNNYPEGYRILCHNCNQSLGYFGYCPHGEIGRHV